MSIFTKSKNGKTTDIFHSQDYLKLSHSKRNNLAFEKDNGVNKSKMRKEDKLRLQGYAQAKKEQFETFKYKNPNYKNKG